MKEEILEKQTSDNHVLLGELNGELIWLADPVWDCNWYWGFGYLHTYEDNKLPEDAADLSSHQHFDSLILSEGNWVETLDKWVVNSKEAWELLDLFKSAYSFKEVAGVYRRGGSYLSDTKLDLADEEQYRKINTEILPKIFQRIKEILT